MNMLRASGDWDLIRSIGEGGFGEVHHWKHRITSQEIGKFPVRQESNKCIKIKLTMSCPQVCVCVYDSYTVCNSKNYNPRTVFRPLANETQFSCQCVGYGFRYSYMLDFCCWRC